MEGQSDSKGPQRKWFFAQRRPDWVPRPFHEGVQVSSHNPLQEAKRTTCDQCNKSRSWCALHSCVTNTLRRATLLRRQWKKVGECAQKPWHIR